MYAYNIFKRLHLYTYNISQFGLCNLQLQIHITILTKKKRGKRAEYQVYISQF